MTNLQMGLTVLWIACFHFIAMAGPLVWYKQQQETKRDDHLGFGQLGLTELGKHGVRDVYLDRDGTSTKPNSPWYGDLYVSYHGQQYKFTWDEKDPNHLVFQGAFYMRWKDEIPPRGDNK